MVGLRDVNAVAWVRLAPRRVAREGSLSLGAVLLIAAACLAWMSVLMETGTLAFGWERRYLSEFVPEIGYAYQARLGTGVWSGHQQPSVARLFEDGRELGPGNAQHDDIRHLGRGQFSFWGEVVYLSAPDNTDPRSNGRVYVAYGPGRYARLLLWLVYLLTGAAAIAGALAFAGGLRRWSRAMSAETRLAAMRRSLTEAKFASGPLILTVQLLAGAGAVFVLLYAAYDPIRTLTVAEHLQVSAIAVALLGLAGFVIALGVRRGRASGQSLLSGVVLFALACHAASYPQLPITVLSGLFWWVLVPIAVAVGVAAAEYARRGGSDDWSGRMVAPLSAPALALIAAALVIPGALRPVLTWWDISGYMDSHSYDMAAHRIATGTALQGDSFVMPLYQYGMALLYYVFGHVFAVQQVANVALVLATAAMLVLTALELFRDYRAAILAALVIAVTPQFRQVVTLTQVENWYVPLIVLTIYAFARYRNRPTLGRAVGLAVAIGLAFNCRAQGAFYFATLCMAPLVAYGLQLRERITHIALISTIVAATLLPWSVRNYIYENRFSPSSDQPTIALVLNDHRLTLYGLRPGEYWFPDILKEYEQKFPDKAERFAAIRRDALANTFGDPAWLARAFWWRSLAFYGLLPPGAWAPSGPVPTDWALEWRGYLYRSMTPLVLILISILGLARRHDRTTVFLAACVLANLAVLVMASQPDSRISFPVYPLHLLLGLCAIFPVFRPSTATTHATARAALPRWRNAPLVVVAVVLFLAICRVTFGRENAYRQLREPAILRSDSAFDEQRARMASAQPLAAPLNDPLPAPGSLVRIRCSVTNYMLPPKSAGLVSYLPRFASDPTREVFYYAYAEDGQYIGVTYFGAVTREAIRENDLVTVEGEVMAVEPVGSFVRLWVRARVVYR